MTGRFGHALLLALVLTGCGQDAALPATIDGSKVARMAERELEAENPDMAPGRLTCPDLALRVGASVRCLRTAELSGGRVVKVRGTVEVTSRASGGRLHVSMDEQAVEFGISGEHLAAQLRGEYAAKHHRRPGALECPYLRGVVGEHVTCHLGDGASRRDVEVAVTGVDASSYAVEYESDLRHAAS